MRIASEVAFVYLYAKKGDSLTRIASEVAFVCLKRGLTDAYSFRGGLCILAFVYFYLHICMLKYM